MNHTAVEIALLVIYLAMFFVLVRPNSDGPYLIHQIGASLAGIIAAAVGSPSGVFQ
jgi:hypothetical protein